MRIKQELPGFIANRLQMALYNEAYSLVSRGIISAADLGKSLSICESSLEKFTNIVIQISVSWLDLAFDGQQRLFSSTI
jgi:hypothetical protein